MALKSILAFVAILGLHACSVIKHVPVESETITRYIDTTIINYKDSTVIIPIERIVDIAPQYDTLFLETSVAKSVTYVDTTYHALRGSIENKKEIKYRYIAKYEDRIIEKVDSVYVEKPITVEVVKTKAPKWAWWTLGFSILSILGLFLKLYLKFKP